MGNTFSVQVCYAGLVTRMIAYVIDVIILFAGIMLAQTLLRPVNPLLKRTEPMVSWKQHLWVFATVTIPVLLYFALCVSSGWEATIGMRLLKIKVVSLSSAHVGFGQAMLRSAVMLLPFELNHIVLFYPTPISEDNQPGFRYGFLAVLALMIVYLGSVLLTERQQSVHDLIARTVVCRVF